MLYYGHNRPLNMNAERKLYTLTSCNIEGDKHIRRVKDFLRAHSPEIVCFQEAPETEVIKIATDLEYSYIFRANALFKKALIPGLRRDQKMGLAILSRIPIHTSGHHTYFGNTNDLPVYIHHQPNSRRREVLYVDLAEQVRVATTHFTWAPNGGINDEQRRDIQPVLDVARLLGECIFAGDFNIPRPNELYQLLTAHFKDHIPARYISSLDSDLHPRGKELKLLVDYMFSTPAYNIQTIEYVSGVSDHMAIIASFDKIES